MDEEKFIGYVGGYNIHGSRIRNIMCDEDGVQVYLTTEDVEDMVVKLRGIKSITSTKPKGMILIERKI